MPTGKGGGTQGGLVFRPIFARRTRTLHASPPPPPPNRISVPPPLPIGDSCMQYTHMCKCMQGSITSNPKISGNKVRDTSRSFNQGKKLTVLLPLDYMVSLYVLAPPIDTACSQKGIGQQEAMFFRLMYSSLQLYTCR